MIPQWDRYLVPQSVILVWPKAVKSFLADLGSSFLIKLTTLPIYPGCNIWRFMGAEGNFQGEQKIPENRECLGIGLSVSLYLSSYRGSLTTPILTSKSK